MKCLLALLLLSLVTPACSDNSDERDSPDMAADSNGNADRGNDADSGPAPAPYEVTVFDDIRISSIQEDENFQKARIEVDFGTGPFADAKLQVKLGSTCYPFNTWDQNPPPEGHNWPADCDAYDRNFEFIMDPPLADTDPPAFELVRAITPFGGPMEFEVDVTDLANARPGVHTIEVMIATWPDGAGRVSGSRGGWNVTANLAMTPGESPRHVLGATPLYNGNLRSDSGTITADYDIPLGTESLKVDYRTTGHGGGPSDSACIGHADEFCKRSHFPFVNGRPFGPLIPWRETCEDHCTISNDFGITHCKENPSGNIDSVRAPRANWCPGSLTEPFEFVVDQPNSETGKLEFSINSIAEGGSWRTSASVFFYAESTD